MKKSIQQYTQLSFNFECMPQPNREIAQVKESVQVEHYRCTKAEFEEAQAIERDLMFGRGAWLYAQLEREMEHERKVAREMAQIEAMRAEAYKYNF